MFASIVSYFRLLSIAGVLLLIACGNVIPLSPSSVENFYLEYRVMGGFGGVNDVLIIEEGGGFSYSARNYNFTGVIDEDQRETILNGLFSNNFFMLKEKYFHKQQIMDVLTFSFTFRSGKIVKEVIGHGGKLPKAVVNIIDILTDVIKDLKTTITSGKVIPYRNWILEEWLFSDRVKLADNVHKKVFVGKEIFDYFKEQSLQDVKIVYLEDGLIYRIVSNGAFGIPYEDHDEFYIETRDPKNPFRWFPETVASLADIPPEGIMVYDADYKRIRDFYENVYSPRYIIDEDLTLGTPIYDFRLYHGSNF